MSELLPVPAGRRRVRSARLIRSLLAAAIFAGVAALLPGLASGCTGAGPTTTAEEPKKLTHEETLRWVKEHQAWRLARKTKPIWARPVSAEEVGREFQTADHVAQVAREGHWLCAGVAGEPWFQSEKQITDKYDHAGDEEKQFTFDDRPRQYAVYRPKEGSRNWAAQVKGPGVAGFFIKPSYDPERPLYSPAGGYVVRGYVEDPYKDDGGSVWLVQQSLFESTYEFIP